MAEGREVMAVPGLVTNLQARGCHQLIRVGASLVESGEDVVKELGIAPWDTLDLSLAVQGLTPEQDRFAGGLQQICPAQGLSLVLPKKGRAYPTAQYPVPSQHPHPIQPARLPP